MELQGLEAALDAVWLYVTWIFYGQKQVRCGSYMRSIPVVCWSRWLHLPGVEDIHLEYRARKGSSDSTKGENGMCKVMFSKVMIYLMSVSVVSVTAKL